MTCPVGDYLRQDLKVVSRSCLQLSVACGRSVLFAWQRLTERIWGSPSSHRHGRLDADDGRDWTASRWIQPGESRDTQGRLIPYMRVPSPEGGPLAMSKTTRRTANQRRCSHTVRCR